MTLILKFTFLRCVTIEFSFPPLICISFFILVQEINYKHSICFRYRNIISGCNIFLNIKMNCSCFNLGRHPQLPLPKKTVWQQRPPLPKYHGTYDVRIVWRFMENLGENDTLSLRQRSLKMCSYWHSLSCWGTV